MKTTSKMKWHKISETKMTSKMKTTLNMNTTSQYIARRKENNTNT